jgi:hypothetical protein
VVELRSKTTLFEELIMKTTAMETHSPEVHSYGDLRPTGHGPGEHRNEDILLEIPVVTMRDSLGRGISRGFSCIMFCALYSDDRLCS